MTLADTFMVGVYVGVFAMCGLVMLASYFGENP